MNNDQKAVLYYRAAATQRTGSDWQKPQFIPKRVRILKTVSPDSPFSPLIVHPGDYTVDCNQWGAVYVKADHGDFGLKLNEFDVIEWQKNTK